MRSKPSPSGAQGGEAKPEERLEPHLEALRRFVHKRMGRLGQLESVSDIVQSTCKEVLEHPEWFQTADEAKFRKWVLVTAQRKILNHARYWMAGKRDRNKVQGLERPAIASETSVPEVAAIDRTPSQEMISQEEMAKIARALERLPEDYRLVLRLSRHEGLSREEVAARLGRSEDSIRNLVSRALIRLAEELNRR